MDSSLRLSDGIPPPQVKDTVLKDNKTSEKRQKSRSPAKRASIEFQETIVKAPSSSKRSELPKVHTNPSQNSVSTRIKEGKLQLKFSPTAVKYESTLPQTQESTTAKGPEEAPSQTPEPNPPSADNTIQAKQQKRKLTDLTENLEQEDMTTVQLKEMITDLKVSAGKVYKHIENLLNTLNQSKPFDETKLENINKELTKYDTILKTVESEISLLSLDDEKYQDLLKKLNLEIMLLKGFSEIFFNKEQMNKIKELIKAKIEAKVQTKNLIENMNVKVKKQIIKDLKNILNKLKGFEIDKKFDSYVLHNSELHQQIEALDKQYEIVSQNTKEAARVSHIINRALRDVQRFQTDIDNLQMEIDKLNNKLSPLDDTKNADQIYTIQLKIDNLKRQITPLITSKNIAAKNLKLKEYNAKFSTHFEDIESLYAYLSKQSHKTNTQLNKIEIQKNGLLNAELKSFITQYISKNLSSKEKDIYQSELTVIEKDQEVMNLIWDLVIKDKTITQDTYQSTKAYLVELIESIISASKFGRYITSAEAPAATLQNLIQILES
jgi:hypothetical protein